MNKQSEIQARSDKKNCTRVSLKLSNGPDADILAQLDKQSSKQGYIKELIRADIRSKEAKE